MAKEAVKRKKSSRNESGKSYTKHAFAMRNKPIRHNYTWLAGLVVVILMIGICTAVSGASEKLQLKNEDYDKRIAALDSQLEEQEQRRTDLEFRAVYITTKQFVEEFAREKLGLVFEDELIFRPESSSKK